MNKPTVRIEDFKMDIMIPVWKDKESRIKPWVEDAVRIGLKTRILYFLLSPLRNSTNAKDS